LYPSDNIDALTCDVWGLKCLIQVLPQAHQIISNFAGRGAAFVKPGEGRPEVSCCPLKTLKISVFIYCIHLTTLMHLHVTERIINAEQQGKNAPSELRLEDLLNEEAGREGDNAEDAEEVTFID
jgi:hypothetical protein